MPKRLCFSKKWLILATNYGWVSLSFLSLIPCYWHLSAVLFGTFQWTLWTHHWLLVSTVATKVRSRFPWLEFLKAWATVLVHYSTFYLADDFDDFCSRASKLAEESNGAPLFTVTETLSSRNNSNSMSKTVSYDDPYEEDYHEDEPAGPTEGEDEWQLLWSDQDQEWVSEKSACPFPDGSHYDCPDDLFIWKSALPHSHVHSPSLFIIYLWFGRLFRFRKTYPFFPCFRYCVMKFPDGLVSLNRIVDAVEESVFIRVPCSLCDETVVHVDWTKHVWLWCSSMWRMFDYDHGFLKQRSGRTLQVGMIALMGLLPFPLGKKGSGLWGF